MLTSQLAEQKLNIQGSRLDFTEINRVLAAAVISPQFCDLLLKDPARAISLGFGGEQFSLSTSEFNLLLSVHADSLPEFARQLCKFIPAPEPIPAPILSAYYQLRI